MRLLADECMSKFVVEHLRQAGHDVAWAAEMHSGEADDNLLTLSVAEDRLLLTEDHDFEALVFRDHSPAIGVLRVAIGHAKGETGIAARIGSALEVLGEQGLRGRFTVVEWGRTRQRDLPRVAERP